MKKILSLFGWIFLLLGVTLIGIGSLAYWRTSQLQAKGESATARITDIVTYHESGNRYSHHSQDSRHHDVYIDYRYHGQRYTDIRLDTYTSSMQIGKKIRSSPKCWCKLNSANLSFHKLKHTGFF